MELEDVGNREAYDYIMIREKMRSKRESTGGKAILTVCIRVK